MVLADELEAIAGKITAEGVAATTDVRNLHPPAVLVLPERVEPRTSCLVRAIIRVVILAPGPGNLDALQWTDTALSAVWAAVGRHPAQLASYDSPATGAALLAYEVTITRDLEVPQ